MREAVDDSAGAPLSGGHELCSMAEIVAQLRRLCRYRSLLSVRRSGEPQTYPTAVLDVQPLLARVLVDALPEPLAESGTALQLHTRFDGAELMFASTVLGRVLHEDAPALAIALPAQLRDRKSVV